MAQLLECSFHVNITQSSEHHHNIILSYTKSFIYRYMYNYNKIHNAKIVDDTKGHCI